LLDSLLQESLDHFKMTVLTKPLTGVQLLKKPEDSLQVDKMMEEVGLGPDVEEEVDARIYNRVTRVGRLTNFCLIVSLMALLILGVGAGVHSYRVFVLRNTYAGTCQLPLKEFFAENTIIGASIKERERLREPYSSLLEGGAHPDTDSTLQLVPDFKKLFEFDFDIDVEEENYEVVELPEIFLGRYMHDFQANLTVIIDSLRSRCFVLPLDRTLVPPPRNMFDLLMKMKQGVYNLNFSEIKKNYRVMEGEVENLDELGYFVPRACFNKQTYRLEELMGDIIVKREAAEKLETYGELIGSTMVQYHIVNLQ